MARVCNIFLGVLVLLVYVSAAPSDLSKIEVAAKPEEAGPTLDSEPLKEELEPLNTAEQVNKDNSTGAREKRWYDLYNYHGYGFPPVNPIVYPNFVKREESETGVYGIDDPFSQIHRRLQDIANVVRQPQSLPPSVQFPIFYPVIFIPSPLGCSCTSDQPIETPLVVNQTGMPDIFTRFPEMEDTRQNWGLVVNESDFDDGLEDDSRPISLTPIRPNRTMSRPSPPVDHGSSQAGEGQTQTTTTTSPAPPKIPARDLTPSLCDGAVLSCCHQAFVTYDCFVGQGCPDPTSYGNPCDPKIILGVIEKYQKFYQQKNNR